MTNEENNKDRNYTVYMHISPNGKRYIGITSQKPKSRWGKDGYGYKHNIYFTNAIKKYGWDNFRHEILYTNLSKEEAENKEIELIAYYKSDDKNYGYNIDHGGNCVGKMSDEQKEKVGKRFRGKNHPFYGKHFTEEHRRKIGEANKGRFVSQETRIKNSKSHKGKSNEYIKKPICQYTKNGELIAKWDCAENVGRILNFNSHTIRECCRKEKKTAHGYIWRYANEELTEEYVKWCNEREANKKLYKPVYQYSKDGIFIKMFESLANIKKEFGYDISAISRCCKGKQETSYGYIWRYAND